MNIFKIFLKFLIYRLFEKLMKVVVIFLENEVIDIVVRSRGFGLNKFGLIFFFRYLLSVW